MLPPLTFGFVRFACASVRQLLVDLLLDVLFLLPHLLLLAGEFLRGEHVRLCLLERMPLLQQRQLRLQRVDAWAASIAVPPTSVARSPLLRIAAADRRLRLHDAWKSRVGGAGDDAAPPCCVACARANRTLGPGAPLLARVSEASEEGTISAHDGGCGTSVARRTERRVRGVERADSRRKSGRKMVAKRSSTAGGF